MELTARLALFGFASTPVQLSVEPRPRWERMLRAFLVLVAAAATAPILFLIPPHAEWLLLSVISGVYWSRKNWIAEFVLVGFAGVCPKCHGPITVKSGTTLRFPHGVVCYSCHEHPALELGEAPPVEPRKPGEQPTSEVRSPAEVRPLRIWSPSSSEW
jgi:predicted CXXCH cytochrome family protein